MQERGDRELSVILAVLGEWSVQVSAQQSELTLVPGHVRGQDAVADEATGVPELLLREAPQDVRLWRVDHDLEAGGRVMVLQDGHIVVQQGDVRADLLLEHVVGTWVADVVAEGAHQQGQHVDPAQKGVRRALQGVEHVRARLKHRPRVGIVVEWILEVPLRNLLCKRRQGAVAYPEVDLQVKRREDRVDQSREIGILHVGGVKVPVQDLGPGQELRNDGEVVHANGRILLRDREGNVTLRLRLAGQHFRWRCNCQLHGLIGGGCGFEGHAGGEGARGVTAQAFQKLRVLGVEVHRPAFGISLVHRLQHADDLAGAIYTLGLDGQSDDRVQLLEAQPPLLDAAAPLGIRHHVRDADRGTGADAVPCDKVHAKLATA
mmetsp:Transcript_83977/g.241418  ORF Transcript_83977/g.241418 Transcript_83977/m.241418 type:complete len:376 (+) Transcript_83977:775-1902(+)